MMKKLLIVALLLLGTTAHAAPNVQFFQNILPEVDSKFDLGSTTPLKAWFHVYADQFCLTADVCITSWPTGSGGGAFPFTPATNYGINTSGIHNWRFHHIIETLQIQL